MIVNGKKVKDITIEGENGICILVIDSPNGNLKIMEVGQYIKNLQVTPQSGNAIILSSSRETY